MNIFRDWNQEDLRKDIVSPILVNLFTSVILFLAALTITPIRDFLFPKLIDEYPLFCTAEAYVKQPGNELVVEFFIINRTKDEWTRQKLIELLQRYDPDPHSRLSPNIELKYWRSLDGKPVGKIGQIDREKDFNAGKGDIVTSVNQKSNIVNIRVDNIKPRAIMKISIPITDIPDLDQDMTRMNKGNIPLDFLKYQDGCYKRP